MAKRKSNRKFLYAVVGPSLDFGEPIRIWVGYRSGGIKEHRVDTKFY